MVREASQRCCAFCGPLASASIVDMLTRLFNAHAASIRASLPQAEVAQSPPTTMQAQRPRLQQRGSRSLRADSCLWSQVPAALLVLLWCPPPTQTESCLRLLPIACNISGRTSAQVAQAPLIEAVPPDDNAAARHALILLRALHGVRVKLAETETFLRTLLLREVRARRHVRCERNPQRQLGLPLLSALVPSRRRAVRSSRD